MSFTSDEEDTKRKMPSYKLTYFDFKGLGEAIRWMLSYLGRDFEDNRIPMDQWPKVKHTIKFHKIPVLEINGKTHYQAQAIMRLLAKEAKLAGDNDQEAYEIDSVVGTLADLAGLVVPFWGIKDPKEKEEYIEKMSKEHMPYYLEIWNENAKNGYLANGKLSWADFFFYGCIETLEALFKPDVLSQYPNLKLGQEKVLSIPGIKEWVAKRPKGL